MYRNKTDERRLLFLKVRVRPHLVRVVRALITSIPSHAMPCTVDRDKKSGDCRSECLLAL